MRKKKKNKFLTPSANAILIITGGLSVLLGLATLLGWHSSDSLVQELSTSRLLRLETIAGFLFCGAGLLGTALAHPRLAVGGLIPACVGTLILTLKLLGLEPTILPLMVKPPASTTHPFADPFPLSIVLCLMFTGAALSLMTYRTSFKRRPLILATLGSIVLALSLVALFGYLTRISRGHGSIYMDIETSIGFQLLGLGIMAFAWCDGRLKQRGAPLWLPLPVGICLATACGVHWQMLIAEQRKQIERTTEYQAESIKNEITEQVQLRILALVHLAKHPELLVESRRLEWESEAAFYLSHYPGLQAVAWMDTSAQVRRIMPHQESGSNRELDGFIKENGQRMTLDSSQVQQDVRVTRSVELPQGSRGFLVYSPAIQGKPLDGFILGIFHFQKLLDAVLGDSVTRGCSIAVFDENEQVYSSDHPSNDGSLSTDKTKLYPGTLEDKQLGAWDTRIDFYGRTWRVLVWFSRQQLAEMRSHVPEVVLIAGLVMAGVVALAVHLAQTASYRTREFEAANQELETEVLERKRTEEALRLNQARLRRLVESDMMGVIVADIHGRILETNDAFAKIVGYTRKELLSEIVSWREMTPAELRGLEEKAMEELSVSRVTTPWETEYIRKDGSHVPVLVGIALLEGSQHNCICFVIDIAERKRAEEELRKEHAENELLLTTIPSILISIDKDKKIKKWNQTAENIFGITSDDAVGLPLSDCCVGWNSSEILTNVSEALAKDHPTPLEEVRFKRPDGKEGFLGISLNPFKEPKETRSGLLLIGADITQRKILESQLRQAQKLESIGQLTAGVAHEINSPMQFVDSNTHFLSKSFGKVTRALTEYSKLLEAVEKGTTTTGMVSELRAGVSQIKLPYLIQEIPNAIQESLEGIQRVTKIVASMKDFSHPGTVQKTAADLNRAIESTITIARNEWKYVAEMVTDFDLTLPQVPCWLAELNQVILNLIVNAAHAISDVVRNGGAGKGTIKVSTRQDGNWVEIRISDTGTGIPEEFRTRIFDPFFTTKEVGKGTGQGLMIAHAVVAKHKGTISFETEIDHGTTFIIRLPIQEIELQEKEQHEKASSIRG